jgi:hypothetical protein
MTAQFKPYYGSIFVATFTFVNLSCTIATPVYWQSAHGARAKRGGAIRQVPGKKRGTLHRKKGGEKWNEKKFSIGPAH